MLLLASICRKHRYSYRIELYFIPEMFHDSGVKKWIIKIEAIPLTTYWGQSVTCPQSRKIRNNLIFQTVDEKLKTESVLSSIYPENISINLLRVNLQLPKWTIN